MALTHDDTLARNGLADYVVDQLDSGHIVFMLANGTTEVATIDLSAIAFGAAASGTATMLDVPLSDTTATGNAAETTVFIAQDSTPNEVFRGVVALAGGDINLSSLTIGAGDTVTLSSFTYSASA